MVVFLLILLVMNVVSQRHSKDGCKEQREHEWDCTHLSNSLFVVPEIPDPEVQVLNLSTNHINLLGEHSFRNYGSLRELYLDRNRITRPIHDESFKRLTNLKVLDIRDCGLSSFPGLPRSIEKLYFDLNYLNSDSDFTKLNYLTSIQLLSLRNTGLTAFPVLIGIGQSLQELDLRENDLTEFSVKNLAPLCKLKILNLDTTNLFKKKSNQCFLVQTWINEYGIKTSDDISCHGKDGSKIEFGEELMKLRTDCLNSEEIWFKIVYFVKVHWFLSFVGSAVTGLCIVLLVLHCRTKKKIRKLRKESISVSDRDHYKNSADDAII